MRARPIRWLLTLLVTVVALSLTRDVSATTPPLYEWVLRPRALPGMYISYALSDANFTPEHPQGWLLRPSYQTWTRSDVQTFVSRYMHQHGYTASQVVDAAMLLSGSDLSDGTCVPQRSYEPTLPPGGWLLLLMSDLYIHPR